MKKLFFVIFSLLLTAPLILSYAQPEKASNFFTTKSPGTVDAYRLSPMGAHRESLRDFNTESDIYMNNSPATKMSAGFINTTTSWADVPLKIGEESEKSNPFVGWTLGFGKGLASGLMRTGAGIIDMATFALPPYDKPLMEPEYKVEKPAQDFRVNILSW